MAREGIRAWRQNLQDSQSMQSLRRKCRPLRLYGGRGRSHSQIHKHSFPEIPSDKPHEWLPEGLKPH